MHLQVEAASPMKGLLKGLRYIARIFGEFTYQFINTCLCIVIMNSDFKKLQKLLHAEDDKEPEMQIGKPTDVKHVAHIGWEGPSATTPSWVNSTLHYIFWL